MKKKWQFVEIKLFIMNKQCIFVSKTLINLRHLLN